MGSHLALVARSIRCAVHPIKFSLGGEESPRVCVPAGAPVGDCVHEESRVRQGSTCNRDKLYLYL